MLYVAHVIQVKMFQASCISVCIFSTWAGKLTTHGELLWHFPSLLFPLTSCGFMLLVQLHFQYWTQPWVLGYLYPGNSDDIIRDFPSSFTQTCAVVTPGFQISSMEAHVRSSVCSWLSLRQHVFVNISDQSALWYLPTSIISILHTQPFSHFTILMSFFVDSSIPPLYYIEACSKVHQAPSLESGMFNTSFTISFSIHCVDVRTLACAAQCNICLTPSVLLDMHGCTCSTTAIM